MTSSGINRKTKIGNLWYKMDGKGGEAVAEVAVSILLQHMGIPHVKYRLHPDSPHISVSRDFTDGRKFQTMGDLLKQQGYLQGIGKDLYHLEVTQSWDMLIHCLETQGIKRKDSIPFLTQMVNIDHLVCNYDRHLGNFGILKGARRTQLAPLFDFGLSLGVTQTNEVHISSNLFRREQIFGEFLKPYPGMKGLMVSQRLTDKVITDLKKVVPPQHRVWEYLQNTLQLLGYSLFARMCPVGELKPDFTPRVLPPIQMPTLIRPLTQLPRI